MSSTSQPLKEHQPSSTSFMVANATPSSGSQRQTSTPTWNTRIYKSLSTPTSIRNFHSNASKRVTVVECSLLTTRLPNSRHPCSRSSHVILCIVRKGRTRFFGNERTRTLIFHQFYSLIGKLCANHWRAIGLQVFGFSNKRIKAESSTSCMANIGYSGRILSAMTDIRIERSLFL